jgi:hypothetical protein
VLVRTLYFIYKRRKKPRLAGPFRQGALSFLAGRRIVKNMEDCGMQATITLNKALLTEVEKKSGIKDASMAVDTAFSFNEGN